MTFSMGPEKFAAITRLIQAARDGIPNPATWQTF